MLTDALVERYSRQILLPEVGGRGQERLGATHVVVSGDDAAARFATTLLVAAGVGVSCRHGHAGLLAIAIDDTTPVVARWHATAGVVATLPGLPCSRCVPDGVLALAAGGAMEATAAHAQAIGALVAAEALRVALGLATTGRVHTIDLARGTFTGRPVPVTDGCTACRGVARPRG